MAMTLTNNPDPTFYIAYIKKQIKIFFFFFNGPPLMFFYGSPIIPAQIRPAPIIPK